MVKFTIYIILRNIFEGSEILKEAKGKVILKIFIQNEVKSKTRNCGDI